MRNKKRPACRLGGSAISTSLVVLFGASACSDPGDDLGPLNGIADVASDAGFDGGEAQDPDGGEVPDSGDGEGCSMIDLRDGVPSLGLLRCNAMQPGERRDFDLYVESCCYFEEPLSACETWRIDPPVSGVEVDAEGLVTVDPAVPAGTIFNVIADLGDGSGLMARAIVEVYSPQAHPAQGVFREVGRFRCFDGAEIPGNDINEVILCGSSFTVTYIPFEVYKDYWGTWTYDPSSGAIQMTVDRGNYIPPDLDLEGTMTFDGDDILLRDIWLGVGRVMTSTPACGHRLR